MVLMCCMTIRSKHFMTIGVSATGQQSLKPDGDAFLGTGIIVVALKHVGTTAWLKEMLKMSERTSLSSSSQSFSTRPGYLFSTNIQCQTAETFKIDKPKKAGYVTSDRQVSCAVGLAKVVFCKAGVLPLICTTDVEDPQNPIWSDCYPGQSSSYGLFEITVLKASSKKTHKP